MQKRIFIAINLPEKLKSRVLDWRKKWQKLRIGWVKPENLHITLVFIGEMEELKVDKISEIARQTAESFKPIGIKVSRIHVGPDRNAPRMIWLSGSENKNLCNLAQRLIESLRKAGISSNSSRGFKLHITLARAKNDELRGLGIDEKFDYSFTAESLEIMESRLSPECPEYSMIEKIGL